MPLLTFPGKVIANLLYDYLGIFWLMTLAVIIGLLLFYFMYKKREFLYIALIFSSILLAFTPSAFRFASSNSNLFWIFILSSVAIGFAYYFIDKEKNFSEFIPGSPCDVEMKPSLNGYVILLALLLVFSIYLRIFKIEQYPAGYSFQELFTPWGAMEYDSGQLGFKDYLQLYKVPRVYTAYSNDSPVVMGLAIPFYKIFGISLVTGRYLSMIWGMFGLLFLFLYLREHFPARSTPFLISFPALELVNVTFSRFGSFHITPFTYTVFLLYLLEVTFKPRKRIHSVLLAFLLGLATFGAVYLYHPTKAAIVIALMILGYKIFLRKGFFAQNWVPICICLLTFFLTMHVFSGGNILKLVPSGSGLGYIKSGPSTSFQNFMNDAINMTKINLKVIVDRVAFFDRARDSLSIYKEGGLVSGPVLCLIPFAIGFALAGVRKERFFTIWIGILAALLPPLLVDVPNASRMLLFISLLLILPGINLYLLCSKIEKTFELKRFPYWFSAGFLFLLFSYNLYLYIDINSHMLKATSVNVPFAESGFSDKKYSKFVTSLANEVNGYTKKDNVYFYYSYVFDENPTAPNDTYEQMFIASYENRKRGGGTLVWMNPFHLGLHELGRRNNMYFYKLEPALKMILGSDRDVKVIFIKPLADEMRVYGGLKAFFQNSVTEERVGEAAQDKYLVMTIKHTDIVNANRQLGKASGRIIGELNSESLSQELKSRIHNDLFFDRYFLLEKDSKILFKNNVPGAFDIMVDNVRLTDKDKYFSLLKGIHSVKVRPSGKEPFVAIDTNAEGSQHFSAPLISPDEAMKYQRPGPVKLYPKRWSLVKDTTYVANHPTHSFYYLKDGEYLYTYNNALFNASNQSLLPNDFASISRAVDKNGKLIVLRYFPPDFYRAEIYDTGYHKIKEFELEGYPFDAFFGKAGEMYITYLNRNRITMIKPDYSQEIWDTSSFSDYPVWNGDVDKNGDIILLSGNGDLYVFDKNRNLYNSFKVDASWGVNLEMWRYGGGVIVSNGIMHVLDSHENSIKSYDKSGYRLCYTEQNCSLFDITPGVKIDFMQKSSDSVVVLDSREKRQILVFKVGRR